MCSCVLVSPLVIRGMESGDSLPIANHVLSVIDQKKIVNIRSQLCISPSNELNFDQPIALRPIPLI